MKRKAEKIAAEIVAIRRDLHRIPELGYQEEKTSQLVCKALDQLGIDYQKRVGRTGVIGEIRKGPGRTVALRADMDALPITEQTGLPFASEHPGMMHACGHDAHTAMLLGAARLLKNESFSGTVRFLFQPSEENNLGDPDGFSGARRMIVEGALEGVDYALGLHQVPMIPTGTISLREGAVLAAADRFEITVHGLAAHAGVNPEEGIDAVVIAAELITLLQTVVSRHVSANDQAVVSIGSIAGGTGYNIIADKVVLAGTTRALNNQVYQDNIARIRTICDSLARMHNTLIEFDLQYGVPVTVNSASITAIARKSAQKIFTPDGIIAIPPMMGGEDFSFIAAEVPACFGLLGTRNPQEPPSSLHHPQMRIDENALPLGAAFLAQTALDLLNQLPS